MENCKKPTNNSIRTDDFSQSSRSLFSSIFSIINLFSPMKNFEEITYENVLEYFINSKPNNPNAVKGIVTLSKKQYEYEITQVFLDAENKPVYSSNKKVYGRKIIAKRIDNELKEAFGENNVFVVE